MTRLIAAILLAFICLDIFVWRRLASLLRQVRHRRRWQSVLAILMVPTIAFAATCMVANPLVGSTENPAPHWLMSALFIWHFLILPPVLLGLLIHLAMRGAVRLRPSTAAPPAPSAPLFSRRHFLAAVALTAPPVATLSLASIATVQLGKFRVRRYHLSPAGWPADMDGFTITLVADVHTGAFSTPKMLRDIVRTTNDLRADLILLGGDLVNISHADLPSALDMVMSLDAPSGVYMIQGNHDVIEGPDQFNDACRQRGVNLLVDQAAIIKAPAGASFQLLGTRWTAPASQMNRSVAYTASLRDPDLFPIMLAHHPHSWDVAAAHGIPLVLAGHTHGGQIMLTDHIGAGPLRFRYWSGLYQKPGSSMIISNGVGNWFPLRINAPAEIVHLTLHRPPADA